MQETEIGRAASEATAGRTWSDGAKSSLYCEGTKLLGMTAKEENDWLACDSTVEDAGPTGLIIGRFDSIAAAKAAVEDLFAQ